VPGYAAYLYGNRLLNRKYARTEAIWFCRTTATLIPFLIWLVFFHRWLAKHSKNPALRDSVFFSVALGSLLYGYSTAFVSHSLSAAVGFGAFMILLDERHDPPSDRGHWRSFWTGLLTASVTFFEYPGLVISIVLSLHALLVIRPVKRLISFALGGLIPTLSVMHFHASAFGNPFTPGHLMVENPVLRSAHQTGIYGAVGPTWKAFNGLLFDLAAGLFPLTPILVFALLGFVFLVIKRRQRLEAFSALAICSSTILVICSMNNWRGGWTIGPRYLAAIVPFMAWVALKALEIIASRFARLAVILALGCSGTAFLASGLPSAYYPHIPPELSHPLPQLFFVLISHDFAPLNAGNLFHIYGTKSMIPLLGASIIALFWILVSISGLWNRLVVLLGTVLLTVCLSSPLLIREGDRFENMKVARVLSFVTNKWNPAGHDQATRLHKQINASKKIDRDLYRRLINTYMEEGRYRKAEEIQRLQERQRIRNERK